jgi:hypothetical protein
MDLNQLLHAHQIAKVDLARAETRAERDGHADTLSALATRIRTIREDGGADVEAAPFVVGEPLADYFDR